MEYNEEQTQTSQLVFTPLMISMIGIVSTALAILLYNIVSKRYCARREGHVSLSIQQPEKGTGVNEKVLNSIPVLAYTIEEGGLFRVNQTECAVCLGEFDEGEELRLLPNCRHAFHVQCIDQWFFSHSNCPVCRTPIVDPYMSSEFSFSVEPEVVENSGSNEDVEAVPQPEMGQIRSHRHSASVVLPRERKLSSLSGVLKRSLSLDYAYVCVKIQRDTESNSPSSSTLNAMFLRNKSYKVGSSKRLDRVSSMLTRSCSRLRSNQSAAADAVLPC